MKSQDEKIWERILVSDSVKIIKHVTENYYLL